MAAMDRTVGHPPEIRHRRTARTNPCDGQWRLEVNLVDLQASPPNQSIHDIGTGSPWECFSAVAYLHTGSRMRDSRPGALNHSSLCPHVLRRDRSEWSAPN